MSLRSSLTGAFVTKPDIQAPVWDIVGKTSDFWLLDTP